MYKVYKEYNLVLIATVIEDGIVYHQYRDQANGHIIWKKQGTSN